MRLLAPRDRPDNTTDGQAVKIISLNTGGLNATIKHTKVITHIKDLNADIMFLEETFMQL